MGVTSSSVMQLPYRSDMDSNSTVQRDTKRTLLIVDDEEGPRHSLWAIFKDDYEILLAETGQQALELAAEHPIDAAVLDIRMPDMSGTELLGKLKRIDLAIEVVMLTAYQTVETARESLRHGACEYLTKPFDIGTMCAAVAHAMERRAISTQVQTNSQLLRELQVEIGRERLQHELTRKHREIYASVLHDINNPLTIVSSLIDLMNAQVEDVNRLEGGDLHAMKTHLTQTNRQLLNCIQISRRYLSFLKPQPSQTARVSLNQALNDLGDLLRNHPKAAKNQILIRRLEEDVFIAINGLDLIQILLNLAMNALQATSQEHRVEIYGRVIGQPLAESDMQDTEFSRFVNRDRMQNRPPLAELTVQDDGPGIPANILQKLFQPYFTTRSGTGGTGLGLSIVQRLVTEAQGGIRVQTSASGGAAFRIYIPCSQSAFQSPVPPP
jgi:two-component system sensor histidine kinase/response regulator